MRDVMGSRALLKLGLLLALCGCGKKPVEHDAGAPLVLPKAAAAKGPGRARGPAPTDADALRYFRAAWKEEISVASKTHRARGEDFDGAVLDGPPERRRLTRMKCRDAASHGPRGWAETQYGAELLLFGELSAFDRDGDCWELELAERMGSTVVGFVDVQTGAAVYAFIAPEG